MPGVVPKETPEANFLNSGAIASKRRVGRGLGGSEFKKAGHEKCSSDTGTTVTLRMNRSVAAVQMILKALQTHRESLLLLVLNR
jgi:hypothetical protein